MCLWTLIKLFHGKRYKSVISSKYIIYGGYSIWMLTREKATGCFCSAVVETVRVFRQIKKESRVSNKLIFGV